MIAIWYLYLDPQNAFHDRFSLACGLRFGFFISVLKLFIGKTNTRMGRHDCAFFRNLYQAFSVSHSLGLVAGFLSGEQISSLT